MKLSDYVLLTNTNPDKGFDLILKVAALAPELPFLAIASQSSSNEAMRACDEHGLKNVTIIERVDDMEPVYRAAKVVAVPSYRFKETFSRVCIEAHRYGKPVIGSDAANVPYLLRDSGIVLPEEPDAWASELERLYSDPDYYALCQEKAKQNSLRYSHTQQGASIHNVVKALEGSLLIGVGSGIGNLLHTTPMIRNIVQKTGVRVDLVLAEDHANSLFLLHNPRYVNAVYSLRQLVLNRNYRNIFITHSFGPARVPFHAERVFWSRDWNNFTPDGLHETLFNLEAAKEFLGIPYDDADAAEYFVGNLTYTKPAKPLIGFHAGSKAGEWLAKRWPYYGELAARLKAAGYPVASFGTSDEFVEGTENRTGGTIEEMCRSMMDCTFFVSNDSGLMNIANALRIPVLAIFAPTNAKTRLPLRPTSTAVVLEKECAPCEIRNVADFQAGHCKCIAEISVDTVERRLMEQIG